MFGGGSEDYTRDPELQKLILEELHHRIKNTLATVGAIEGPASLPGLLIVVL